MIVYTDGTWRATFNERGKPVKFGPDMGDPTGCSIIRGGVGRKMIRQIRQLKMPLNLMPKEKVDDKPF